jgi:hypothetical protein
MTHLTLFVSSSLVLRAPMISSMNISYASCTEDISVLHVAAQAKKTESTHGWEVSSDETGIVPTRGRCKDVSSARLACTAYTSAVQLAISGGRDVRLYSGLSTGHVMLRSKGG